MKTKTKTKSISAEEFDKKFDNDEDISEYIDKTKIKYNKVVKRVNVDFTTDILSKLDQEANRIGVPRTAFIKMILAQYLDAHNLNIFSNLPK